MNNKSQKNKAQNKESYELLQTASSSLADNLESYMLSEIEILKKLETNLVNGLTSTEANHRLRVFGPNELDKAEPESLFSKIKEQFEDLLVRLLLLAAIISFVVSQFGNFYERIFLIVFQETQEEKEGIPSWLEPLVIFLILILNAVVGIYQDYDAENALEALKELQTEDALVLRDNIWTKIKARNLVPGDIVQVN